MVAVGSIHSEKVPTFGGRGRSLLTSSENFRKKNIFDKDYQRAHAAAATSVSNNIWGQAMSVKG